MRKWGVAAKSVPSSNIQITVAFPNTLNDASCDGEPRWDVTYSMISDDPMNQMTGVASSCYSDVRPSTKDPENLPYSTNSYMYTCRGGASGGSLAACPQRHILILCS